MNINSWQKKSKNIVLKRDNNKLIIINNSNEEATVYSPKIIICRYGYININFVAKTLEGSGAVLKLINRKKMCKMDAMLNAESSSSEIMRGIFLPIIVIKPHTTIEVNKVELTITSKPEYSYNKYLGKKKILLISPGYPSPDNLYSCGFVHARVKEYLKSGLDIEIASVYNFNSMSHYEIEGVQVYRTPYNQLRSILMSRKYDAILVHFLDEKLAYYLDTSYIKDTPIILWNHGADILYWKHEEFNAKYFEDKCELSEEDENNYRERDKYIQKFAKQDNIYWVFVSESEKREAEEIHKITFKNSVVIPNIINGEIFSYKSKAPELRKKIFMIRRFDNIKKYAIDIAVQTILELSKRPFFNDLEFFICGEGEYHSKLVEPLREFKNVNIINNFLNHKQIKEYHDKCGIGLFPTRQDIQGVSALEAASSGLVVVTSDLDVIHEYFDESLQTICSIEEPKEYADVIERLYNNPEEFETASKKMYEYTQEKCCIENTINKEIDYIKQNIKLPEDIIIKVKEVAETPILTIAIPSYNAEKFLHKCLQSLLKSEYSYLTEILVINDGSKDETSAIGKLYQDLTTVNGKSIVKVIDKENGGHGSGINKGIELARGKYFKVVDADDWVDEAQYNELLKKLVEGKEDADLIVTHYCEARSYEDKPYKIEYYNNLEPEVIYHLDDVCTGPNGFKDWGPTLPTSTYKTECLRKANFKLLEKTFYVDMTYNAYSIMFIDTIKRYDLNIYRYYIGNAGQSVSQEGMIKNYKHHENVLLELMNIVTNDTRLTDNKREYILNKLLLPMVYVQYYTNIELLHSGKILRNFEKRIKKYPQLLGYHEFHSSKKLIFHRYTHGIFLMFNPFLERQADRIRRVLRLIKKY